MLKRTLLKNGLACSSLGVLTGCTKWLWEHTDSGEMVWFDADSVSEEEMKSLGVHYEVYQVGDLNGYLVEREKLSRFKDISLRVLGTPLTLVVDGTGYVVLVSGVFLYNSPELVAEILEASLN
ncbi:hypothetical protein P4B35_05165 [Pontiellaceae bacterium B12227]|nr:hypothetical protein [Pontiellaceae bacterium B12227]